MQIIFKTKDGQKSPLILKYVPHRPNNREKVARVQSISDLSSDKQKRRKIGQLKINVLLDHNNEFVYEMQLQELKTQFKPQHNENKSGFWISKEGQIERLQSGEDLKKGAYLDQKNIDQPKIRGNTSNAIPNTPKGLVELHPKQNIKKIISIPKLKNSNQKSTKILSLPQTNPRNQTRTTKELTKRSRSKLFSGKSRFTKI